MRRLLVLGLALMLAACGGGAGDPDHSTAAKSSEAMPAAGAKALPSPTDTALVRPGDQGDGSIVMVNGRAISPVGDMRSVRNFPSNALLLPGGVLAVSSMRSPGFMTIDAASLGELGDVDLPAAFHGLAANAAGDRLWVSGGGAQQIYEYALTAGSPALVRTLTGQLMPAGMAVTPDESKLLVCNSYGAGVEIIDLETGALQKTAPSNMYPYEVLVSPDGVQAYVSNWGDSTITVINIAQGKRVMDVAVGLHPEGMALSPDAQYLYVANADSDTVSVVDVAWGKTAAEYDIYDTANVAGATPTDVAVSSDGATLYVAAAGLNAVVVLDEATGDKLGMIPTGYYPLSVALDEANDALFVVNGKGGGIPGGAGWGVSMNGTLQKIALPSPAELTAYTQQVTDNLTRTALFWETLDFESPIPTVRGQPSQQIKRVVFLMRENKTFDQVYGDFEGAERDPAFLVYGAANTPNGHALASQFTLCDNYYSEANVSLQGHMWSILMYSNDYNEKAWAADERYPLANIEPASSGARGSIWKWMYEHDVTFRIWGQVIALGDIAELAPYIDLKYGFWNLGVSDEIKAGEIIRELDAGIWPQLLYISLHNDHTNGADAGQPTPRYFVGDNDAGLGKLIDYFTHSPYWGETAIFVLEDDPQSGADHVDAHRSPVFVISPWAKHGYVSSVLYSMSSIWMTIELILGLPPMSVYDENTSPMYDCFTMTPDNSTYTAQPNPIPLEFNPSDGPYAALSARQDWSAPDQVRRLGEITWGVMRPGEPFPWQYSVDGYALDEDEEEEGELDAAEYRQTAAAIEQYALEHGLWDGTRLPTIREMVERGELQVGR